MTIENLIKYITKTYNTVPECPWAKYPNYVVVSHNSNKKWFAVIMDVPKTYLGQKEEDIIEIINLECNSNIIGSLLLEDGFYPAYHMNKNNWVSVEINKVSIDKMKILIHVSFNLTK